MRARCYAASCNTTRAGVDAWRAQQLIWRRVIFLFQPTVQLICAALVLQQHIGHRSGRGLLGVVLLVELQKLDAARRRVWVQRVAAWLARRAAERAATRSSGDYRLQMGSSRSRKVEMWLWQGVAGRRWGTRPPPGVLPLPRAVPFPAVYASVWWRGRGSSAPVPSTAAHSPSALACAGRASSCRAFGAGWGSSGKNAAKVRRR